MKIQIEISRKMQIIIYAVILVLVAAATFAVMALLQNIKTRKLEAKQYAFEVVKLTEDTVDPNQWGKNFPRQFDGYKRTADIARTTHGGSEAFDKLAADPRWKQLFKGYSFAADYREERGHASIIPTYRKAGKEAGIPDSNPDAQIEKGFEIVSAMPYSNARKLVSHPVACIDCHDPVSMQIRVTRPGFINAIAALADSNYPLANYPSIAHWRAGPKQSRYDANKLASRQEMRSMVCGQCHVEYYFKGTGKLVTYAWHNGLKAEQIESYYDGAGFKDWTHPDSNSPLLKAQHPEFELWNQGVHAKSGVACADCHMPYKREGAVKISDHHVRSPMLNINRACQTCHHYPEEELKARVEAIQDTTTAILSRTEDAVLDLIAAIKTAKDAGATDDQLKAARDFHRKAQWRLDFISAENSTGFHAPQEAARLLAEAIDYARQGMISVSKIKTQK